MAIVERFSCTIEKYWKKNNSELVLQAHGSLMSASPSGLQTTTSLPGGLYPPTPSPMPPLTPMTPMTAEQAGIVPQLQ